jgi:two-component system response regulator DesR
MIRVLLAEDQAMIRGALLALIGLEHDMTVVADVERGDEVVGAARKTRPDVAVLDIDMPGIDGLSAAAILRDELPETRILILTGLGQPGHLTRALEARVGGFMKKDAPSDELADAIRRVAKGQRFLDPDLVATALEIGTSPLTAREAEVLRVAADGGSTEEIGQQVYLSPATVRNYLSSSISKLGARNRIDAIRIAREAGWL